jgi:hypothetical protein
MVVLKWASRQSGPFQYHSFPRRIVRRTYIHMVWWYIHMSTTIFLRRTYIHMVWSIPLLFHLSRSCELLSGQLGEWLGGRDVTKRTRLSTSSPPSHSPSQPPTPRSLHFLVCVEDFKICAFYAQSCYLRTSGEVFCASFCSFKEKRLRRDCHLQKRYLSFSWYFRCLRFPPPHWMLLCHNQG